MRHSVLAASALMFLAGQTPAYEPAGTPDDWPPPMMHSPAYGMLLTDRLETRFADDVDSYLWDIQGWYGGDRGRWWFKSEGEGGFGSSPEDAELQLLYGRMLTPFWDWQIGVRHSFHPSPHRTHLVLGLQGVAPYELEIDSALFISDEGDVAARFEAEYDVRVTQRLILQPRFELNGALSDDRERGIGSGINNTELGFRLRYELRRELAPYVGVSWEQLHGGSADIARELGEGTRVTSLVVGLRAWF